MCQHIAVKAIAMTAPSQSSYLDLVAALEEKFDTKDEVPSEGPLCLVWTFALYPNGQATLFRATVWVLKIWCRIWQNQPPPPPPIHFPWI
jgi:hypothetical protein